MIFPVAVLLASTFVGRAYPKDTYKLKPGGEIRICLECHTDFRAILNRPFIHTPVKLGKCSECHNPHTSSHGKLLFADPKRICTKCHEAITPKKAKSNHKVVSEGDCTKCHDPHGGNLKYLLTKTAGQLCLDCHKNFGGPASKIKFKHDPVEKTCLNCHNPHASQKFEFLLKEGVPSLCVKCHRPNTPAFARQHLNYPVEKSRCTGCHNAHGSDKPAILYDSVHRPMADKNCTQCHFEPTSGSPFKTKRVGFELCRGCHSSMINEAFAKNRIHWPLLDKVGCLNCHAPHASPQKGLLNDSMLRVCDRCHADTIARQKTSVTKHAPVFNGECMSCHTPHASNETLLFNKTNMIEICGTCHEWQKHVSHPLGEKVLDPRNKSLRVDCGACHRAHGTENKNMLTFATVSTLCTQCHEKYKR
jgi:DmsE family decaheme c-type cytochrome